MPSSISNKVDLHLHLDGALSYTVVDKLMRQQGISLSQYTEHMPAEFSASEDNCSPDITGNKFSTETLKSLLTVGPNCQNLVEYLKCFDLPSAILQTEAALTLVTFDLIERLEAQGLVYAEIRFAPQLHTVKGMTQQKAVEAVLAGVELARRKNFRIRVGILLCMMVTGDFAANKETAELSVAYRSQGVVGLDLAGAEGAVPMSEFESLFGIAYQADLPFTIHAGECGSYDNIAKAVSFGARRIGHGCAAIFSEDCMNLLRREKIVLEMCPTSNLQTRAVSSIQEHPIRRFFDEGILVTVNTDNMTVSDTCLEKEYQLLREKLNFTDDEIIRMNETAIHAGFIGI